MPTKRIVIVSERPVYGGTARGAIGVTGPTIQSILDMQQIIVDMQARLDAANL